MSPSSTVIWSAGIPISVARIWANVVAWPWPWLMVPRRAIADPRGMDPDLARIEHPEPEDVAVLDRSGPYNLGEERDPDAHQGAGLAARERLASGPLLRPERLVVDRREGLLHRRVVVARVVLPAERRRVGELLAPDEVPGPDLGWVHVEPPGEHVDHPLDEVRRLGDPERAAVRDPARRLVGVHPVHRHVGGRDVVGAGADVEEAGREPGRVRAGVEGAVVRGDVALEARDPAVAGRRDLARHVVVARKGGRDEVLDAVLDPLDGDPGDDRGDDRAHVPGVDADLVAESTADVRRDDPDVVLGMPEMSEATVPACGAWNVPHTVSLPFTLSIDATQPQVSSGQGWTRW